MTQPKKQSKTKSKSTQITENTKCYQNYDDLANVAEDCRKKGLKIVLTQGTFDMLHIGHARYLQIAKKHGNFLIVGVDSDEKVRSRKGPDRPVVPEHERIEMLSHLKYVDAVVLKGLHYPKWELIRIVRPHVLIATQETYTKDQASSLKEYCDEIVVLGPMATTSTSAKVRKLQIGLATRLEQSITPKLLKTIEEVFEEFRK